MNEPEVKYTYESAPQQDPCKQGRIIHIDARMEGWGTGPIIFREVKEVEEVKEDWFGSLNDMKWSDDNE